ncbi:LysE family translocator [uncultured Tateyamaria sp.]|uniref:LysE family translocator n=1 Tax=uncultured Tateyamaria sp. TaxID=455651 RepID=UPI00261201BD|nr:LysE family translocator [uncultured Tateyamaria sp.]
MDALIIALPGILIAYGVFVMGMFSPGPNILSIMGTSMGVGRDAGKSLALGIASGSLIWGLLAWGGLTTVLVAYASLMTIIKIAGAAYLLWLAFKSFRSAMSQRDLTAKALSLNGGASAYYRRGLLIQMTNPKAALTWTVTISLGLSPDSPWWIGGIIVLGTGFISFGGHMAYALAFSTKPMVAGFTRARRWIETGLGMFFCFASYKLVTTRA